MRTVPYSDVLQKATEATGRVFADLSVSEAGLFRGFLGTRLRGAWEMTEWPDLLRTEERKFRAEWDGTVTYGAPSASSAVEVFYAPSQKYYQSLRGTNLNHAPATFAGNVWTENSAWWAESKTSYGGNDWAATTVYAVGTIVRRTTGTGADQRFYQCHTAHTSGASFDTTQFGILTDFDRYVAYEQTGLVKFGEVLAVLNRNPKIQQAPMRLKWRLSDNGVQVYDSVPTCWLRYRLRAPFLKGANFQGTAAYAVDEQVYFSSTSAAGNVTANFYDCLATTVAAESPITAPAKWALVPIPYTFAEWLIHASAADMLSKDAKDDWSADEMILAQEAIQKELDKLERQQGQEPACDFRMREAIV